MCRYSTPEFLWAEAIATSVCIHNRLLDSQTPQITSFEAIFKRKPNLSHLREFRSEAYALVPDQKRTVWSPKGRRS
jgi:hypothetical protein